MLQKTSWVPIATLSYINIKYKMTSSLLQKKKKKLLYSRTQAILSRLPLALQQQKQFYITWLQCLCVLNLPPQPIKQGQSLAHNGLMTHTNVYGAT